jgi:hypothetical protein
MRSTLLDEIPSRQDAQERHGAARAVKNRSFIFIVNGHGGAVANDDDLHSLVARIDEVFCSQGMRHRATRPVIQEERDWNGVQKRNNGERLHGGRRIAEPRR